MNKEFVIGDALYQELIKFMEKSIARCEYRDFGRQGTDTEGRQLLEQVKSCELNQDHVWVAASKVATLAFRKEEAAKSIVQNPILGMDVFKMHLLDVNNGVN